MTPEEKAIALSYYQPGTGSWYFEIEKKDNPFQQGLPDDFKRNVETLLQVLKEWTEAWEQVGHPAYKKKHNNGSTHEQVGRYKKAKKRGNPSFLIEEFDFRIASVCHYTTTHPIDGVVLDGVGLQVAYAVKFPYGGMLESDYREVAIYHKTRIDYFASYFNDGGVPCSPIITTFNPWDSGEKSPGYRPQNYLGVVFKLDLLTLKELEKALRPIWTKVAARYIMHEHEEYAADIRSENPETLGAAVKFFVANRLAQLLQPLAETDPFGQRFSTEAERQEALKFVLQSCDDYRIECPNRNSVEGVLSALHEQQQHVPT